MPTLIIRRSARTLPLLAALCVLPLGGLFAGPIATATGTGGKDAVTTQKIPDDVTPLDSFEAESSYVGGSNFRIRRFSGDGPLNSQKSYGDQDETQEHIEYSHRIHLVDRVYLKLGAAYERFNFGAAAAPLPTSLQSISGTIAVEYVVHGRPAVFITSSPGVYFSDIGGISTGNFDAATALGGIVPLGKSFYLLVGVRASILARQPVLPILGVVWLLRDNLRVEAVPPEPRLIYTVNDKLDLFLGGELLGDAYKRDETHYTQRGEKRL